MVWRRVEVPTAIMATCENCGEVVHRVLKGKLSGRQEIVFEGVVKCQSCGKIRTLMLKEPKPLKIPVIISWMDKSERLETEMEPDAPLKVGELIDLESGRIEVTAIESKGRRVPSSHAREVDTLWAKRADKVRVKVTLSKSGKAWPKDIFAEPDEEFCVGDFLEIGKDKAVVQKIKIEQRTMYRGCAAAADIKRIYAAVAKVKRTY